MQTSYEVRDYGNRVIATGSKEHCVKVAAKYGPNEVIGYDTTGQALMLYTITPINYEYNGEG
jgi:hypothetical protein